MNKYLILVIALLLPTGLLVYNYINNKNFYDAPFYAIINIFILIVFTFFLTQLKTDERKYKEVAEKLISKVQHTFDDKRTYEILNGEDLNFVRIVQRSISNRIGILKNIAKRLNVNSELTYIDDEFTKYWEFISEHIEDLNYLSKSQKHLLNHVTNIQNKFEEVIFKLYD